MQRASLIAVAGAALLLAACSGEPAQDPRTAPATGPRADLEALALAQYGPDVRLVGVKARRVESSDVLCGYLKPPAPAYVTPFIYRDGRIATPDTAGDAAFAQAQDDCHPEWVRPLPRKAG